jgi:hypothetical protein
MMVGEKIDCSTFLKGYRPFEDMQGLVNAMRKNTIVWCWAADKFTKMNDFCLRFAVNGHLHKGHVYVVVNSADLFDLFITSNRGKIKTIINDVYLGDLIDTIDNNVETVKV